MPNFGLEPSSKSILYVFEQQRLLTDCAGAQDGPLPRALVFA